MRLGIPTTRSSRIKLGGAFILGVTALFFLASTFAQQAAPGPKPDDTALAQLTAIVGSYGGSTPQPSFTGEMNGFTFRRDAGPRFEACGENRPFGTAIDHGSPVLTSTDMDFDPTYVPPGMNVELVRPMSDTVTGSIAVGKCDDTVVSLTERWRSSSAHLTVSRQATAPVIQDRYSRDRLEETVINGRSAIIVKPRIPAEATIIFLRDEISFWTVSGEGLSLDEVTRVARGLE